MWVLEEYYHAFLTPAALSPGKESSMPIKRGLGRRQNWPGCFRREGSVKTVSGAKNVLF
jgi:hypothetical protein